MFMQGKKNKRTAYRVGEGGREGFDYARYRLLTTCAADYMCSGKDMYRLGENTCHVGWVRCYDIIMLEVSADGQLLGGGR